MKVYQLLEVIKASDYVTVLPSKYSDVSLKYEGIAVDVLDIVNDEPLVGCADIELVTGTTSRIVIYYTAECTII